MKFFSMLCLLATLVSCSQKSKLDNNTLLFNLETEPPTLDLSKSTDTTSALVIENLFDGLTAYDISGISSNEELKITPKVAERWTISKDGKTYTFYLRKDVLWSDGKTVTAHDFEYSWKRLIDPSTASEYAYFLFDVKNAKEFNERKIKDFSKVGMKALNEYTFQITLIGPRAYFIHVPAFAGLSPLRKDVVEQWSDAWTDPKHIVTNGPYRLTSWKHDYEIILERNDTYYDSPAKTKTIRCLMVTENSTALSLYQTRKLDLIRQVPALDIPRLKQTPEFHSGNFLSTYFLGLNTKKFPLTDINVRRALASSIDREQITRVLEKGDIPTTSLIPKGLLAYNPDRGLSYDPLRARQFMEKAGYTFVKDSNGRLQCIHAKTKKPFPTLSYMFNTSENHKTIAESVQAQWKNNLGINIELDNQEWKVYQNTLHSYKNKKDAPFHIYRLGWNADYPDPDNYASVFTSYSENNHTGWSNAEYDHTVEKAKTILEPQKRIPLYAKAEKILVEQEVPIIPLYVYAHQAMWREDIQGVKLNPLDTWYLDQISIARK